MNAPNAVDECGEKVPADLIYSAKRRNLAIKWGPETHEWSLVAEHGGASIGIDTRQAKKDQPKVNFDKGDQRNVSIELTYPRRFWHIGRSAAQRYPTNNPAVRNPQIA